MIPYARQDIDQTDIEAVVAVLKSAFLTQGPTVPAFELQVANYCGAKYAVAVNSATSGLHIACLAVGVTTGDWVWTSPITFVASANCALYCGANIDFVDIDPHTYNLSITKLADKLAWAKQHNCLPKVVIPVHLAGQSCQMAEIHDLAQEYGFYIIEDASHAIGALYKGQPVGNCQFSDMTVFSFHPVKIITTGEGGMVLTNNQKWYQKLIRLRTHGITRNPELMKGQSHGAWYYQQLELGFNYRMNDIEAALGISQMKRLQDFVNKRRYLAQRYNQLLKDLPILLPSQHPDTLSSWHLYIIRLQLEKIEKIALSHRQVFDELRSLGIGVNLHYIPVHLQPYYQDLGFQLGNFPNAEAYYADAITLPLYYQLTESEQDTIVEKLKLVLTGGKNA